MSRGGYPDAMPAASGYGDGYGGDASARASASGPDPAEAHELQREHDAMLRQAAQMGMGDQMAQMRTETSAPSGASAESTPPLWLDAWSDPMANVDADSACVESADLAGDGEWRLVVAGADRKLKVWNGTKIASEHDLLDAPAAVKAFYGEHLQGGGGVRRPFLAVAAGAHVFIYRNLRPYYKFTVPPLETNSRELEVWARVGDDRMTAGEAWDELSAMRDNGIRLTSRSVDFLDIEDGTEDFRARRERFAARWRRPLHSGAAAAANAKPPPPPTQHTSVTCFTTLKRESEEWDAPESLVFGTEHGQVFVLDAKASGVEKRFQLDAAPAFVSAHGCLEGDHRVAVACRDSKVYTVKDGELSGIVLELEAQPVGLIRTAKHVVVGCMNDAIHCYHARGKKLYTVYVPAPIQALELMEIQRARTARCVVAALKNGEIRVYNDKHLVGLARVPGNEPIRGVRFGRLGREDNALAVTTKSGALHVKILPRLAKLDPDPARRAGPPPEQDIPLPVPKKTKLYVEQTQRERECGVEMHRAFQRDLCKLRLGAARAYLKVLGDGGGGGGGAGAFRGSGSGSKSGRGGGSGRGGPVSVRLDAQVQGLGPLFKIFVKLVNAGNRTIRDVPIHLSCGAMYALETTRIVAPALPPGLAFECDARVTCVDPGAGADVVKVFVCDEEQTVPVITAVVKMPLSEFFE